jgi:hypothetical protein
MAVTATSALRAVVIVSALGCGAWGVFRERPLHPADGILVAGRPRQDNYEEAQRTVREGKWTLTPRARYDITARVLKRERYRFDAMADLSPLDLALGWGQMSGNEMLNELDLTESKRELHETVKPTYEGMDYGYVLRHSSNNHMIPLDAAIERQLIALRVGQVVQLKGDLVDAHSDDGWYANTSLTREDEGDGACEVMLVRGVQIKN